MTVGKLTDTDVTWKHAYEYKELKAKRKRVTRELGEKLKEKVELLESILEEKEPDDVEEVEAFFSHKSEYVRVRDEWKLMVAEAWALFEAVVQSPVTEFHGDPQRKLDALTMAWQDWQEKKLGSGVEKGRAKKAATASERAMIERSTHMRQQSLFPDEVPVAA